MNRESLKRLFDVNRYALRVNLEGITHEESLREAPGGGNCLNWIVGHIVANRGAVLSLLQQPPIWGEKEAGPYRRGSAPLRDPAVARPLDALLADHERTQEAIRAGLEASSDADLAAASGDATVGDRLAFLHFHEAYHVGQTAILRRSLGREGAIK